MSLRKQIHSSTEFQQELDNKAEIERLKMLTHWPSVTGAAREWWLALECELEEEDDTDFLAAVLEELELRDLSVQDLYWAYIHSNSIGIELALEYLDFCYESLLCAESGTSPGISDTMLHSMH